MQITKDLALEYDADKRRATAHILTQVEKVSGRDFVKQNQTTFNGGLTVGGLIQVLRNSRIVSFLACMRLFLTGTSIVYRDRTGPRNNVSNSSLLRKCKHIPPLLHAELA